MNIYLKEMGNLSLLSHEEEVALAQLIEHGEMRVQLAVLSHKVKLFGIRQTIIRFPELLL